MNSEAARDGSRSPPHAAQGFFARVAEITSKPRPLPNSAQAWATLEQPASNRRWAAPTAGARARRRVPPVGRGWNRRAGCARRCQFDLAEPALAKQRRLQLAQMGLDVAVRRQVFHQYVEDAAAGGARSSSGRHPRRSARSPRDRGNRRRRPVRGNHPRRSRRTASRSSGRWRSPPAAIPAHGAPSRRS